MFWCPFFAYDLITSSVCGPNQRFGPTFDWYTSRYGFECWSSSITFKTVEPTSLGYVSPVSTTFYSESQWQFHIMKFRRNKISSVEQLTQSGSEWAENSSTTPDRSSGAKWSSSLRMLSAKASTKPWLVDQRSMNENFTWSDKSLTCDQICANWLMLLPVVLQLYCGYCEKTTTRSIPSRRIWSTASSVNGSAYRKPT